MPEIEEKKGEVPQSDLSGGIADFQFSQNDWQNAQQQDRGRQDAGSAAFLRNTNLSIVGFDGPGNKNDDKKEQTPADKKPPSGDANPPGDKAPPAADKNPPAAEKNPPAEKDQPASEKKVDIGKPGDNNIRDVDKSRDNPTSVKENYNKMVDGLGLPADESARLKEQFGKDMAKIQEKFKGNDLDRVMRSMNLMMEQDNFLGTDKNRVNAASGLAARGADARKANRQGDNPTCSQTSQSRIEQQRDFAKYADQMGSVASRGGAWRGGENGTKPVWVDIDAKGTNHANLTADRESSKMYNPDYHQKAGHRDYLGQLNDALIGNEMAKYAGQRDGKDYVYVSANAHKVDGADAFGQGASGNTLMAREADGKLKQHRSDGAPQNTPPSTMDMVAAVNHSNGGGGLFVHENLANNLGFRRADGSYPPGMKTYKDLPDLTKQLGKEPGKEFQICVNEMVTPNRTIHSLHAMTILADGTNPNQLYFRNNWSNEHNKYPANWTTPRR